jgi:lipoyl(octanoyl) transferase
VKAHHPAERPSDLNIFVLEWTAMFRFEESPFAVHFHLLGTVPFPQFVRLQRRIAYDVGGFDDGRIVVLLCQHTPVISVGRRGSRGHVRLTNGQLRAKRLELRWVNRGGGCLLHAPGQVSVCPMVPLAWHGWSVGDYLRRLQQAVQRTLDDLRVRWASQPGTMGLWGRSGQLAGFGVSVRQWVTGYGAYINVNPAMHDFSFVDVISPDSLTEVKATMGCVLAERRQAVTMPKVRSFVVANLAAAFGTDRYHLFTGHPLLASVGSQRELTTRAS